MKHVHANLRTADLIYLAAASFAAAGCPPKTAISRAEQLHRDYTALDRERRERAKEKTATEMRERFGTFLPPDSTTEFPAPFTHKRAPRPKFDS